MNIATVLCFAILFCAAFLLKITSATAGQVPAFSPYALAQDTVLTSLLWMLLAYPVTRRIGKAAFIVHALILLAVPLGSIAALWSSGAETGIASPLGIAAYAAAWAVIALPTAFVFTAVRLSLLARQPRPLVAYLGSLLFFFTASIAAAVATNVLQMPELGKLLDPTVRFAILVLMPDTLTLLEKDAALIALKNSILVNRLVWISLAAGLLAFTTQIHRRGTNNS